MKIFVRVKPRAKEEKIEPLSENGYVLWVKEPAQEGKANAAVVKLLARHFHQSPASIKIISGQTSRQKVIEVGAVKTR